VLPSLQTLYKISQETGTNLNWIVTGEGFPFIADSGEEIAHEFLNASTDALEEIHAKVKWLTERHPVKLLARIHVGQDGSLGWQRIEEKTTSEGIAKRRYKELGPVLAIKVKGDWLPPLTSSLHHVIVVQKSIEEMRDGYLAIVRIRNEGRVLKRIYRNKDAQTCELHGTNSAAPVRVLTVREKDVLECFHITGLVFG
jgi:hypothetical protein